MSNPVRRKWAKASANALHRAIRKRGLPREPPTPRRPELIDYRGRAIEQHIWCGFYLYKWNGHESVRLNDIKRAIDQSAGTKHEHNAPVRRRRRRDSRRPDRRAHANSGL